MGPGDLLPARQISRRLDGAQDRSPGQLAGAGGAGLGERPNVFAVYQFDANRAQPVEVVVPGGLTRMGSVDPRKMIIGTVRRTRRAPSRLVVGDAERKLRDAVGCHGSRD